ncbi:MULTISPECIES: hypothetical protein [unclassified Sphingobium]|uniref:hypothetical protein n=1 Tax=unclassified Sphingobium TaxID=2611147 RepID=UPI0022251DB8|nr:MULTISPECIES: hypothetical protein [unclassified Sphingobium]MCW2395172.1 hypothetical protein [Sphingobium sp. B8D3B]MCW2418686.1 hypothetical protein [Sphingobium sp. B8D3C]
MTVAVDTPDGIRTGYSVQETIVSQSNVNLGDISVKRGMHTRGEAVAVDLGNGNVLFALLCRPELTQAVLDPEWKNNWIDSAKRISGGATPAGPIAMDPHERQGDFAKPTGYPALVRFRNLADPTSVKVVDPANLEEAFGPGYRLRQITLQLTQETISGHILSILPWLPKYINRSFFGERFNNPSGPLTKSLRAGNFSTQLKPL